MHSVKIIALAAALVPTALAQFFGTPLPTSTAAEEYLSDRVRTVPSTITGAVATSLASALYSVDQKYFNDKEWTTVYSHMWSAAAKATNAPDVVASMAVEGYSLSDQQEAEWWKDNVPDKDNKWVSSYVSDWQKAWRDVAATKTSKGGAPKCTGMAIAGVAAGVAAGVIVAMRDSDDGVMIQIGRDSQASFQKALHPSQTFEFVC